MERVIGGTCPVPMSHLRLCCAAVLVLTGCWSVKPATWSDFRAGHQVANLSLDALPDINAQTLQSQQNAGLLTSYFAADGSWSLVGIAGGDLSELHLIHASAKSQPTAVIAVPRPGPTPEPFATTASRLGVQVKDTWGLAPALGELCRTELADQYAILRRDPGGEKVLWGVMRVLDPRSFNVLAPEVERRDLSGFVSLEELAANLSRAIDDGDVPSAQSLFAAMAGTQAGAPPALARAFDARVTSQLAVRLPVLEAQFSASGFARRIELLDEALDLSKRSVDAAGQPFPEGTTLVAGWLTLLTPGAEAAKATAKAAQATSVVQALEKLSAALGTGKPDAVAAAIPAYRAAVREDEMNRAWPLASMGGHLAIASNLSLLLASGADRAATQPLLQRAVETITQELPIAITAAEKSGRVATAASLLVIQGHLTNVRPPTTLTAVGDVPASKGGDPYQRARDLLVTLASSHLPAPSDEGGLKELYAERLGLNWGMARTVSLRPGPLAPLASKSKAPGVLTRGPVTFVGAAPHTGKTMLTATWQSHEEVRNDAGQEAFETRRHAIEVQMNKLDNEYGDLVVAGRERITYSGNSLTRSSELQVIDGKTERVDVTTYKSGKAGVEQNKEALAGAAKAKEKYGQLEKELKSLQRPPKTISGVVARDWSYPAETQSWDGAATRTLTLEVGERRFAVEQRFELAALAGYVRCAADALHGVSARDEFRANADALRGEAIARLDASLDESYSVLVASAVEAQAKLDPAAKAWTPAESAEELAWLRYFFSDSAPAAIADQVPALSWAGPPGLAAESRSLAASVFAPAGDDPPVTLLRRDGTAFVPAPRAQFAVGGRAVAFADGDHSLLFDLVSGKQLAELPGTPSVLTVTADGSVLAVKTRDGIDLWRIPSGDRLRVVPGKWQDAQLSPVGAQLALVAEDGTVRLEALDKAGTPRRLPALDGCTLGWSGDGTRLAGFCDKQFVIVEAASGKTVWVRGMSGYRGYPFRLDRRGEHVLLGRKDDNLPVRVVTVGAGEERDRELEPGPLEAFDLSADGTLAVGPDGKRARCWDLAAPKPKSRDCGGERTDQPSQVLVTPSGRQVVVLDEQRGYLLTQRTHRYLMVFRGNQLRGAFSPDGRRLVLANGESVLVYHSQLFTPRSSGLLTSQVTETVGEHVTVAVGTRAGVTLGDVVIAVHGVVGGSDAFATYDVDGVSARALHTNAGSPEAQVGAAAFVFGPDFTTGADSAY